MREQLEIKKTSPTNALLIKNINVQSIMVL